MLVLHGTVLVKGFVGLRNYENIVLSFCIKGSLNLDAHTFSQHPSLPFLLVGLSGIGKGKVSFFSFFFLLFFWPRFDNELTFCLKKNS